jgi:hypothetical protein
VRLGKLDWRWFMDPLDPHRRHSPAADGSAPEREKDER